MPARTHYYCDPLVHIIVVCVHASISTIPPSRHQVASPAASIIQAGIRGAATRTAVVSEHAKLQNESAGVIQAGVTGTVTRAEVRYDRSVAEEGDATTIQGYVDARLSSVRF